MDGRDAILFVDHQDRTWDVEFKMRSRQLTFTNGWRSFVTDNNLEIGDVCAFVLNRTIGVSFHVFIFRLENDTGTPLFQGNSIYLLTMISCRSTCSCNKTTFHLITLTRGHLFYICGKRG